MTAFFRRSRRAGGISPVPSRRLRIPSLRALETLESRLATGSVVPIMTLPIGLAPIAGMEGSDAAPVPAPATVSGKSRVAPPAVVNPASLSLLTPAPFPASAGPTVVPAATLPEAAQTSPTGSGVFQTFAVPAFVAPPTAAAPVAPASASPGGAVSAPTTPSSTSVASMPATATNSAAGGSAHAQSTQAPATLAAAATSFTPPDPNISTLAAVGTGAGPTTQLAVTADHALWWHADGGSWTRIGSPNTILSATAVAENSGRVVGFIVTGDHAMFRYDTTSGWQMLGNPGSIRAVSAGTDSSGMAAAFVLTSGDTFNEYRGSSGWLPSTVGGAGSVLTMSAGRGDRVSVVTTDHSVFEYSGRSGWLQRTAAGFAREVHAVSDAGGNLAVYAITQDNALFRHDDGIGWRKFGASGTIGTVAAGTDQAGHADAFVITANGVFLELSDATGWKRLGDPGTVETIAGANAGRVALVTGDGSVFEFSDGQGWARLTSKSFAAGSAGRGRIPPIEHFLPGHGHFIPPGVHGNGATGSGSVPASRAPTVSAPAVTLTNGVWTPIGPAPILNAQVPGRQPAAGRITGVAADPTSPNTIYIAAAGGGVWKTADGGASWTALTDGQALAYMGAIAVAPNNPSVVYAGTGENDNSGDSFYGVGVLASSDGGATWTLEGQGLFNRRSVTKIAVDPTNPSTLYVAIGNSSVNGLPGNTGIWKSTDGGATFTNTTVGLAGPKQTDDFTDVLVDPSNPQTVYMAVGTAGGAAGNGVYKSTNGGTSWAAAGNFPIGAGDSVVRVAIAPSAPSTLYSVITDPTTSGFKVMLKTTDAGQTWNPVTDPRAAIGYDYLGFQGDYDSTLAVDPSNANIVYAGGGGDPTATGSAFIGSTNGGASWKDLSGVAGNTSGPHADHHSIGFDASGRLLVGTDGGIWRLDDPNGPTWSDLNGNLQITQFTGSALTSDPNTVYGGSQDNGDEKYTGNPAWNLVQFGDGGFMQADQTNPDVAYHTFFYGFDGFLERTDDGGVTWNSKTSGINTSDPGNFYVPYVMDPSNSSRLVLGTNRIYETTNRADSWHAISTPGSNGFTNNLPIDMVAIAPSAPNTIYVTAAGHFFVTFNDGTSWNQIDIPGVTPDQTPAATNFQGLAVNPTNDHIAYAARTEFNGTGNNKGHVFQTTDGGTTWTDISGNLPDIPAWSLAVDATTPALYVGTDSGVFSSTDGGQTWAAFGTGIANAQVKQLNLNTTLCILEATTYGRGIFETSCMPGMGSSADMAVTLAGPSSIIAGTNATYTVAITNSGPNDAQGVVLTDTLPAGSTFVSMTQTGGSDAFALTQSGGKVTERATGTIATGSSDTFSLVVFAPSSLANGAAFNDTAAVRAATPDPNQGNNTATVTGQIGNGGGGGGGGGEDRFEPDDTSDTAHDFGAFAGAQTFTGLTVATHANGLPDYDWYRATATGTSFQSSITIRPVNGNLELHLFTVDSTGSLIELAKNTTPGALTKVIATSVSPGEILLVEVKGTESAPGVFGTGSYDMTLTES